MANYAASVLAKAQLRYNEQFQAAEMRTKPSSALMMMLKNRDFLFPDIKELRKREDRPTSAYLKNRSSRALGSARAHNHSGGNSDSTEVSLTYTTYSDKFSTSLKRADGNILSDAEILQHEIDNLLMNFHEGIETAFLAWLDTNKNTVSAPPSGSLKRASFNATNDVYEIGSGNANQYWHILKSILRQERLGGQIDIVADSLLASTGDYYSQQGTGNSTNLGFQFSGMDVAESIELADSNYANGISLAWPTGLVGVLDWIPRQNREGKGDFDTYNGGFGSFTDPMTGVQFAVHAYTERADTSGTNGNVQDEVTQWEFSVDLSPQKAPTTTAGFSPIFAIGQL